MNYYECNLHAFPDGSDSASRLALASRRLGYSGIIICNHTNSGKIFGVDAAEAMNGIEVAWGMELVAKNPRDLHIRVNSLRRQIDFLAVHGGQEKINRSACENAEVDLLVHPQAKGTKLGVAAAKAAKDNQVAIGLDLSPMMRFRGGSRIKWMETVRRDLVLIRKFDLGLMITTSALSHLDLRAPRDLMALSRLLGLEKYEAEKALLFPKTILELNRKRWISPGVELL
ncbi:MAG: RNase P subunit p30 family protein [Methanotrichaceae archaeon]